MQPTLLAVSSCLVACHIACYVFKMAYEHVITCEAKECFVSMVDTRRARKLRKLGYTELKKSVEFHHQPL